jgi:glyoxylase-like metal-dependent hydrolase (beta-lactamase superfamily II)
MAVAEARSYFPRLIEDEVYYCGFTSPKSYGATSYFIRRNEGNWLTDSPRFNPHLVERFEAMGGLRYIFLTHRDDVADADLYARRFGAQRIIHEGDLDADPDAEIVVRGRDPVELAAGFTIIPVPGHTRGHCVLLHGKFLFTGAHLWGDEEGRCLEADSDYCWYDWAEQTRSMELLRQRRFEWVLPGHGRRIKVPADRMRVELARLIGRMKAL